MGQRGRRVDGAGSSSHARVRHTGAVWVARRHATGVGARRRSSGATRATRAAGIHHRPRRNGTADRSRRAGRRDDFLLDGDAGGRVDGPSGTTARPAPTTHGRRVRGRRIGLRIRTHVRIGRIHGGHTGAGRAVGATVERRSGAGHGPASAGTGAGAIGRSGAGEGRSAVDRISASSSSSTSAPWSAGRWVVRSWRPVGLGKGTRISQRRRRKR